MHNEGPQASADTVSLVVQSKAGMMALLSLTIAIFVASIAPSVGKVEVYPNILKGSELRYLKNVQEVQEGSQYEFYSKVLDKSVASRIHKITGTTSVGDIRRSIAIKQMTASTDRHTDGHYHDDGTTGMAVQDEVAFIFLDTNPEASFSHGEDIVQSEAGTLVVFKGNVPHNTIVNGGSLRIAGPFHLESFRFVGDDCFSDADCERFVGENYECICPEAPIRERKERELFFRRKRRAAVELAALHESIISQEDDNEAVASPTRKKFKTRGRRKLKKGDDLETCDLDTRCVLKTCKKTKGKTPCDDGGDC